MNYTSLKTPGVYVNEISIFPPSVAQVPTAIPAFVGYTERSETPDGEQLKLKPFKISSLVEFQLYYGSGPGVKFEAGSWIELDSNASVVRVASSQKFFLFDSLQLFFANGGGDCYIVSVGTYDPGVVDQAAMESGVDAIEEVDEPTMIVFPDAVSLTTNGGLYTLQAKALGQCVKLGDRVGVFDLYKATSKVEHAAKMAEFRSNIGMTGLKYGAVYSPWIKVAVRRPVKFRDIFQNISIVGTNTQLDLAVLAKGPDEAAIKQKLKELKQSIADGKVIRDKVKNLIGTQPTLSQYFDTAYNASKKKLGDAEIAPTTANVDASAAETIKVIQQVVNVLNIISAAGLNAGAPDAMTNKDIYENTWKILFGAVPGGGIPANAAGTFQANVKALQDWNTSIRAGNAIGSGAAVLAALAPVPAVTVVNIAAGVAFNPALAGANEADRIANQKTLLNKMKELFSYFNDILNSILTFIDATEKAAEDTVLKLWPVYKSIVDSVSNNLAELPPSGAIAGIYARVDNERGVWKAPANVSITLAKGTVINITDGIQDSMNVDVDAGKSVNAIRTFSGKGTMVWGGRTLAGNDNEWRYVSVRRFFNMVEESVKKSTSWVVFEPNDANSWLKVKTMIENFLTLLWREGALAGSKPEESFRVYVGLNQTMTAVDILEGRMIIRIEMAVVRPAEFIVLEFAHKLQTS